MAVCHTQNLIPSSALQRERRKAIKRQEEYEQEEMNLEAKADAAGRDESAGNQGASDRGELGSLQQKKKAAPPKIPIHDMIPYLVFHRDVSNEEFRHLADQLKHVSNCITVRNLLEAIVVTYARYACVADCADAMADAWEDTAGCAQPICLHENLLK